MVKDIYTEYDFYLFHFHQAPGVFLSISLASRTEERTFQQNKKGNNGKERLYTMKQL